MKTKSLLEDGLEAVNILMQDVMDPFVSEEEVERRVGTFFEEFGIDPDSERGVDTMADIRRCRAEALQETKPPD